MNNHPPHYINDDEYFQSSVLIAFAFQNNEYSLVLEQRSAHISQAGEVCFPGGRFDQALDPSTKDTAIRETCEELGVRPHEIHGVNYWGTYIAPTHTLIDVYIGMLKVDDVYNLPINKDEVEKLLIIPFSYFIDHPPLLYEIDGWSSPYRGDKAKESATIFPTKELGLPTRYHAPWKGKPRKVYVYPTDDIPIWGITAYIIKKLVTQYPVPSKIFAKDNV